MVKINAYNDGDQVPRKIEDLYDLRDLNLPITNEGKITLDFVGVVIKENRKPLVVFPKKYNIDFDNEGLSNQIPHLLKVLEKGQLGLSASQNTEQLSSAFNFPLRQYLHICLFYNRYGLYLEENKRIETGYRGKINWQHTMNRSPKILNQGNIVFMPFRIEESENIHVFITSCMEEVLAHGYSSFGQFFDVGVKYMNKKSVLNKKQTQNILQELREIKFSHFKDSTRLLIENLISYFEWKNNNYGKDVRLITKNFEDIWEDMVHYYLSNNNLEVDTSSSPHIMEVKESKSSYGEKFHQYSEVVPQSENRVRDFRVEYDHIRISHEEKKIMLFDSKYFDAISGLNYKQVVYAYFLLSKYKDYQLINGLVLPTEDDYYSKTHIDRENIDNVYITEHYLNLKEIMKQYTNE